DSQGPPLPLGTIFIEEDELLDAEALRSIEPEEQFEGYTGNAGMTLDRWYRHGAVVLWPDARDFEILCGVGSTRPSDALRRMVQGWQEAQPKDADARKARCLAF